MGEEPGRLQAMGPLRVRYDRATNTFNINISSTWHKICTQLILTNKLTIRRISNPVVFKLKSASESPRKLIKTQTARPHPRLSDLVGLG